MGLTHTQKLGRDIKGSESSGRPSLLFLIKRSKTILPHHRSFMCLLKRFWYKLYQFGGFHLTFQSEDDAPSAQRPTAVSEDQSCKAVLERVKILDNPSKEESASCFTDVMTQIAQDVAYDVRGSPFSHNKIGQYFYLVESELVSEKLKGLPYGIHLGGELSNHNLLAMPVRLEQKENVDALVQKVSMLLCLSQCISDENRGELRKTRTGSTDLHRQGTVSASNIWRFKRISVISGLLQRQTEENTK
ncbi:hypothetical protein F2Q70_00004095 [Brassica cretica]|uniref:Uncharacterized protein n=1 Tax=Brassica cretica TaxID=69181 RepID=A0A8S9IUF3_BRACR|nr:hypothetical protein F2Q70_00004095 [Brassica cretica]